MQTFAEFHNALRILANIDMSEMVEAGAIASDDTSGYSAFAADPWRWLIRAGDDEARAVWRIVLARQPKKAGGPITLAPRARLNIEEMIEAESAVGDPQDAADLTMLLKAHDGATELLTALKRLATVADGCGWVRRADDALSEAFAAIAKAEGR